MAKLCQAHLSLLSEFHCRMSHTFVRLTTLSHCGCVGLALSRLSCVRWSKNNTTRKTRVAHLRGENPEHGVLVRGAGFAGARKADEQHRMAAGVGVMPSHLPDQHFSSEGSLKTDSLVMISSSALVSTTAAVQQSHSQRSHLHQMLPASSTISQRVEIGHRYARVCHVCPLPLPAAVDRSSE